MYTNMRIVAYFPEIDPFLNDFSIKSEVMSTYY
jgi:hypothetical protein